MVSHLDLMMKHRLISHLLTEILRLKDPDHCTHTRPAFLGRFTSRFVSEDNRRGCDVVMIPTGNAVPSVAPEASESLVSSLVSHLTQYHLDRCPLLFWIHTWEHVSCSGTYLLGVAPCGFACVLSTDLEECWKVLSALPFWIRQPLCCDDIRADINTTRSRMVRKCLSLWGPR